MSDKKKKKRIRAFMEGRLSGTDLQVFEQRIKDDPEFAEEVTSLQEIDQALESLGTEYFREEIMSWEKEISGRRKLLSMKPIWAVAAVLLALIALAMFLFITAQPSMADLYATHYSPYQNMLTNREGLQSTSLQQGLDAYDLQNYEEATSRLRQYLEEGGEQEGVQLYLGIAQMNIADFANARENLTALQSSDLFSQQAQWYLFLLYLKMDDQENARLVLEEISTDQTHYKTKVASLILDDW